MPGDQHQWCLFRADGSNDLFPGEQSHGHGSLCQSTHQRKRILSDSQSQQPTDVADQHECSLIAADHRIVELNALFQLENAGGSTGKVHHFAEGEPLKASIAAEQAQTQVVDVLACLLYTSPSPRDRSVSRMPSSA